MLLLDTVNQVGVITVVFVCELTVSAAQLAPRDLPISEVMHVLILSRLKTGGLEASEWSRNFFSFI